MELSAVLTSNPVVPVVIGLHLRSGVDLGDHSRVQRRGATDLARELETLAEQDLICTQYQRSRREAMSVQ